MKDSNPRVRKAAVIGCAKVWRHSPDIVNNNGIVDILYTMVRDPEPSVMTFALQTINVILVNEGGVVINSAMANYLLSRLEECKDLEKAFILEYLLKHKPKNSNARYLIKLHCVLKSQKRKKTLLKHILHSEFLPESSVKF